MAALRISQNTILQIVQKKSPVPFLYQTRTLTSTPTWSRSRIWESAVAAGRIRPLRPSRSQLMSASEDSDRDDFIRKDGMTPVPEEEQGGQGQVQGLGLGQVQEQVQEQKQEQEQEQEQNPQLPPSYIKRRAAEVSEKQQQQQQQQQWRRKMGHSSMTSTTAGPRKPKTTMTNSERMTIIDLLHDIGLPIEPFLKRKQEERQQQYPERKPDSEDIDRDRDEMSEISSVFDTILKQSMQRKENPPEATESDSPSAESEEGRRQKIPWPGASLEGVGQRMKDVSEHLEALDNDDGHKPLPEMIGKIVQRESSKIESALLEAVRKDKGDVEIFNVCKERIFSMIRYLASCIDRSTKSYDGVQQTGEEGRKANGNSGDNDLTDSGEQDSISTNAENNNNNEQETKLKEEEKEESGKEPNGRIISSKEALSPTAAKKALQIPTYVPIQPVILSLYPRVILMAFRLLAIHYPNSPLIASFSSSIRSQGRASSIVGSSTSLYNELLYFSWHVSSDLRGVISHLHEMEVIGIEGNHRTVTILRGIVQQREADMRTYERQQHHESRVPWWDVGPNRRAYRELAGPGGWIEILSMRINRKGQLSSRAMKEKARERINYE